MLFSIFRANRTIEDLREEIQRLKSSDSVDSLEREKDSLEAEVKRLKEEIQKLKVKRKIEDEDIKHMIKMKEERKDLEYERKVAEIEASKAEEIAAIKDEYRDKIEQQLETQKDDMKEMYGEILKRLPDMSVRLKGNV